MVLATTDLVGDLTATLPQQAELIKVKKIEPAVKTARYRQEILASKGAGLDEIACTQLAEDLASPCTKEAAVFLTFAALLAQAVHTFVVVDTAPTGHTLLLAA